MQDVPRKRPPVLEWIVYLFSHSERYDKTENYDSIIHRYELFLKVHSTRRQLSEHCTLTTRTVIPLLIGW